jgi:hypothetical protein
MSRFVNSNSQITYIFILMIIRGKCISLSPWTVASLPYPFHQNTFNVTTLNMFGDFYELWSSSLFNILSCTLTSSVVSPNVTVPFHFNTFMPAW